MMATQVLLLGATGHIGGTVLEGLLTSDLDVTILAQVRSEKDSIDLKSQYAQYATTLKTVVGSYNDPGLNAAVRESSIVINAGPDVTNEENIRVLLSTLAASITSDHPKFYVGTTGAALIWDTPDGNSEARTWDDVADVDYILALPERLTHAVPDRVVQSAVKENPLLHTALVSPTFVSGIGPSRKRPTPLIFPDWLHVVKSLRAGVTVNGGKNVTTFVHVRKLARLYVHLVQDALERLASSSLSGAADGNASYPAQVPGVPETWGPKAYYFAASLEIPFHSFMSDILLPALKKHGALSPDDGPGSASDKEVVIKDVPSTKTAAELILTRHAGEPGAEIWSSHIAEGFGVNMRVRGSRAEKVFGAKGFRWVDGPAREQGDNIVFVKGVENDAGLEESVRVYLKLEAERKK